MIFRFVVHSLEKPLYLVQNLENTMSEFTEVRINSKRENAMTRRSRRRTVKDLKQRFEIADDVDCGYAMWVEVGMLNYPWSLDELLKITKCLLDIKETDETVILVQIVQNVAALLFDDGAYLGQQEQTRSEIHALNIAFEIAQRDRWAERDSHEDKICDYQYIIFLERHIRWKEEQLILQTANYLNLRKAIGK